MNAISNDTNLKHIVFIEDDPLDFEVYESAITEVDPNIILSCVERIDDDFRLKFSPLNTLVILDLNLRGIDGLDQYADFLRPNGFTTYVHTSSDNPSDIIRAKKLGIIGYFQKKTGRKNFIKQFNYIIAFYENNLIKELKFYADQLDKDSLLESKDKKINSLTLEVSKLRSNTLYPDTKSNTLIRETDDLFIKIAKSFSAGIYIYDLEKNMNTYMNSCYSDITGFDLDEINALSADEFLQLFHPDDLDSLMEHMGEIINSQGSEVIKLEYRFRHKLGHWVRLLSLDRVFTRSEDGKAKSFIGSFFEI